MFLEIRKQKCHLSLGSPDLEIDNLNWPGLRGVLNWPRLGGVMKWPGLQGVITWPGLG